MRFFLILQVLSIALLSCVLLLPVDELTPPDEVVTNFTEDSLVQLFGNDRSLSHKQTRDMYRSLLASINTTIRGLSDDISLSSRAATCSRMRSTARRYARSRDSVAFTDILLQARDSYVHGVRFFPLAVRQDLRMLATQGNVSFLAIRMTMHQIWDCLFPSAARGGCPSYEFLKFVAGKDDRIILGSCTKSNEGFNNL